MSAFESKDAYWGFAETIRSERRFIFDGKAGKFLAAARAASHLRAQTVKAGSVLYRAQVGSKLAPENDAGIEEELPLSKARIIPNAKYIKNGGRANPSGIAYLYLASTKETALAEMRPWLEESVTLAAFEIKKDIKLVVCKAGAENWEERLFEKTPSATKLDQYVWNDISRAFSRPVSRDDEQSAYLPTQILAEAFKAQGLDGLACQSGLERGTNVVLFDVRVAKLTRRFVYTMKKVRYEFEAVPNFGIYRKKGSEYIGEIRTESP